MILKLVFNEKMKIKDLFPTDNIPNVFKKKKFKKTKQVPKLRKSVYGIGPVGINVPVSSGCDYGGSDGGGDGGGGGE